MSLLLIAGTERNPGPRSESTVGSNSVLSETERIIEDKFSIVYHNVQSIVNKLDLIESELRNFDVICIIESWIDRRTPDEDIQIEIFKLFRRDSSGDHYVGIFVYVRNNVYSGRRNDLELPNIECLWVEVSIRNNKQLIGTLYRPPNSSNVILSFIEDSVGLAFASNIQSILITGGLNLDTQKENSNRKIRDLCQQFNFKQLINEPTHSTENSSSAIDFIITANSNNILMSGVGEPFLQQNIRYHCPVFCVLNVSKPSTPSYQRKLYLYDKGKYQTFSTDLAQTDREILKDFNMDTYAVNITERITALADKHIPNKLIKVRKSDPAWLTTNIKKRPLKKKRLYDKYKKSNNVNTFETYKRFMNLVTKKIRKSKKLVIDKLTENFLKNQILDQMIGGKL